MYIVLKYPLSSYGAGGFLYLGASTSS